MKFGFTADLHFSKYSQDPLVNGIPERLYSLNKTLRNIIDYIKGCGIDTLVIGGDINHNKSIIHSYAFSIFIDIIRSNRDIRFILIDGNHDLSSRTSEGVSSVKLMDNEPNITNIHTPITIENIFFVPWNEEKMVTQIKNGKSDYLISHFGLNEGVLSSGISIISEIGIKDLQYYKKVLLGHYHKPQEISNEYVDVCYVGSPIHLDWGEKNEEKRFLIVDSEKYTQESILTEGYKKYISYDLRSENSSEILSKAKEEKDNGHHVNINILEKVDYTDFKEIGVRIVDKVQKDITDRGITMVMSETERLTKFLEIKKIPLEKREEYLSEAVDIINYCDETIEGISNETT